MTAPPTGTVTFLFTDIEGSTRLLQRLGDVYGDVLSGYRQLVGAIVREWHGHEVNTAGDACLAAFRGAREALSAAVAMQRAIRHRAWPEGVTVPVRMGLHTGEPLRTEAEYVGMEVHEVARICAAGHGGQVLVSDTVRTLVEHDLPAGVRLRDLGAYDLKDIRRPQRLFQVLIEGLATEFPPLRTREIRPGNLPRALTSFIGRTRERAEIKELLSATRLLTLTGAGGSGKTRLALQVGVDLVDAYADGVWLVELAALADPALVPQTIASALGVPQQPGRTVTETLTDFLGFRSLLLVVDNCEHLAAACAHLGDVLLRGCAKLRILATSREDLGVAGEVVYRVPSLAVPDPDRLPPLDALVRNEAVRLFAARAAAVLPAFRVAPENARSVARICRQVDGLPLAIELAAARVGVLTVDQIAGRLHGRLGLLTGGSRVALPRHQTLRATMDWSYDLLSDGERAVFRRVGVFAGGWALEAAEAVCGEDAGAGEVLDLLARLVQRSLVAAEPQARDIRYRMLETIREYAREKLRESGEEASIQDRHSQWYLSMAERAEPELRGAEPAAWLARLDAEHDNIRVALQWLSDRGAAEAVLRLAVALWRFWFTRGYLREGRARLEAALRGSPDADPALRLKALTAAGYMALNQEDYTAASALLEESLAIGRHAGDGRRIAIALNWLGVVAWRREDFDRAAALFAQGLAASEDSGAEDVKTRLLNSVALLSASRGDFGRAQALLEECLAAYRRTKDKAGVALAAANLAVMVFRRGDHAAARSGIMDALALFRELGDLRGIACALQLLGILAVAAGRPERAARILGAAQAVREIVGAPFANTERILYDYERHLAAARAALGEEVFARAWAEGGAMRLEEAAQYAGWDDIGVPTAGHP